jgi:hypothetical protein
MFMFAEKRGFSGQQQGGLIGLMLLIIIAVGVVIPVVQEMADEANLTGITATLVNLAPMLIAVLIVIYIFRQM